MPTVLITGASTGIGRASALRLAAGGWRVFAGVRSEDAGRDLLAAASWGGAGGENGAGGEGAGIAPLLLDVTDADQIAAAAGAVGDRLDGLVNNAGIGVGGPLELVSDEELRQQFEVNVFGQLAVTRALLGALRTAKGRIVLISSVGGRVSVPFNGPYAASKHAIEAIGDALRGELHSSGIAVSLVEPGSVKTPIWDKARATAQAVRVPPELEREYGHVQGAFTKVIEDSARRGVAPEKVAATIERALTARRPRARYLVGVDARGMVAARAILPSGIFDRILRRALGV
ncbi:MAG TPA: SDR family oxidoreductase [Solirubrobacteraceae bacterium]|nr:SDR family oxidoreductase [Solirubrobacteraceae bacterium]